MNRRCSTLLTALAFVALPGFAQQPKSSDPPAPGQAAPVLGPTIEGRSAAPVPTGANVSQIAAENGGLLYEKARIRRTVPLDPSSGLDGNWDALYSVQDGTGQRTAYCDWDNDYLYLAVESPNAQTVRFDIDGKNDGWLRGADNLTIQVTPGANDGTPTVTAYRFDTVQNRDMPVWAASPIPAQALLVKTGKTTRGTFAVTIAVPRTGEIGLERKPGQEFGLRVDAGNLPDPTTETANIAVRPMMRLSFAENIEARTPKGLRVSLKLSSPEQVLGEQIKATMEVKNEGAAPVRINRMYLRGSQSSFTLLDSANLTGEDLAPGKTLKRELKSGVSPTAPFATLVLSGGIESDEGATAAALASFAHVEPYEVRLEVDKKPAGGGADVPGGFTRSARLVVRSRTSAREKAKVALTIPPKWRVLSVEPKEKELKLNFRGDAQAATYKLFIPVDTPLGAYPLDATVDIGGRTYRAKNTLSMVEQ